MNALEKVVGSSGDEKGSETLTVIYIKLGRELQQQLEELRSSKKPKELKAVSEGFETFLKRIAARDKGNTWSSLNWVAETFYSLGTGYDEGQGGVLSADAKRYYSEAVNAYKKILDRATSDPKFAPNPEALIGVQLRMAVCMRKIGNFDEAIKTIVSVLKDRPMMLPAQIMGAETYQAKGITDKTGYAHAILGGPEKDAKNQSIIWGWAKLSKLTMNNDKFVDTFHEARIKLAECRFQYGTLNKNKAKRRKTINAAREDLWITYKLYPDLGGQARSEEYNRMLKQIQRGLGEKVIGLEEFRRRSVEIRKTAEKLNLAS
jgi:tetratricopeptide (TPR) repeat protein